MSQTPVERATKLNEVAAKVRELAIDASTLGARRAEAQLNDAYYELRQVAREYLSGERA